jgi:hypothetical protein
LLLALIAALSQPAAAQSGSSAPAIVVPNEIRVPPASVTRMQVFVKAPRGLSEGTMLVFRGLPQRVMLSEGRRFSAEVWAVPIANVGSLEIAPAIEASGTTELVIELTTLDGKVLATANTVLSIGVQASEQTKTVANTEFDETIERATGTSNDAGPLPGTRQQPGSAAVKRLTAEESARARKLMDRGNEAIAGGKVTAARLLYQAAADAGWAPGALALAQTYDSHFLSQSKVLGGVQPDPALAKKWYEKAAELGATEATARPQALR